MAISREQRELTDFQISVWFTQPERPKGAKDEVKRPEGPPARSQGPGSQVPQPTCYWNSWQLGNLTSFALVSV